MTCDTFFYMPMQLVAPRAVTIAVAILAIIGSVNGNVKVHQVPRS